MPPRFTLLHATYHRAGGPLEVRDAWLRLADRPEQVEYIVAMDADDSMSVAATEGLARAVGEPLPGVTSVRNWNAAAAKASGDLLFVIADDLFPPQGWDTQLAAIMGRLDPSVSEFAVKVSDDPTSNEILLRHPVVSRAFYARHGLFSGRFQGVYCDNDLTRRAFWKAVILDGTSLMLDHRHPTLTEGLEMSTSHQRVNAREEYDRGQRTYAALWPEWQRAARVYLVPRAVSRGGARAVMVWRAGLHGLALAESAARLVRRRSSLRS